MRVLSSTSMPAITKGRLLALASLVLTWLLVYLLPRYKASVQAQLSSQIHGARRTMSSVGFDWCPVDGPGLHYNASKLALLVEPRPIPHLVPLIAHMAAVVPPDWRFLFVGSQWSVYSVGRAPAIRHQQAIGRMDVLALPKPWSIERQEDVSRLLTDLRFYDEFLPGAEWILKFERDSILCANSPTGLDEWLDWSWAGASLSGNDRLSCTGGLSLRRVSAVRRVLSFQRRHNDSESEEEWFFKRLSVMPGEKVSTELQGALAAEKILADKPIGYHVPDSGINLDHDVWKDAEVRRKIFEYCPELSLIMDMKLERERCPDDDMRGGRGSGHAKPPPLTVKIVGNQDDGNDTSALLPPQPPPRPTPALEQREGIRR